MTSLDVKIMPRLHMGFLTLRLLQEIQADRITCKGEKRDDNHEVKVGGLPIPHKTPDHLSKSQDSQPQLEIPCGTCNTLLRETVPPTASSESP